MAAQLQKVIFDLKFTERMTKKRYKKAESERKAAEALVKKELEKGRPDVARISAAKAVRKEKEYKNLMELENRLNAITGQLETAAATRQVAQDMKKVSLSLQKINQKDLGLEKVYAVMENFNIQTEQLDLTAGGLENMMNEASATSTNPEAEDALLKRCSDEVGVETTQKMPDTESTSKLKFDEQKEDDLAERLRRVRA